MAAKTHDEFCEGKHLLTTGNCHMVAECEECREIWNAATKAAEEKFVSTVPNTGSPKLPLLEESFNDLSAEFGGEFDSIKFQRGASAMYGYIVRQLQAGGV